MSLKWHKGELIMAEYSFGINNMNYSSNPQGNSQHEIFCCYAISTITVLEKICTLFAPHHVSTLVIPVTDQLEAHL